MNTELGDMGTESVGVSRRSPRPSLRAAARDVVRDRLSRAVLGVAALTVAFAYSVLLPFDYTERLSFQNWHYLNAYLLIWAIALGAGMGIVLSVQVHAVRRIVRARALTGVAGGFAFVGSLLPSFLCCTPIIPTVLSFVGVSGVGLYGTTGTLQHFFAAHQTEFLAGSLALLVFSSWWGLRKVATAACLAGTTCEFARQPNGHPSGTGSPP
ncbi:MAG: hypothetical protein KGL05_09810 [Acidobacteriota bacterium]|nr:hypothetical protein [Acidobacteriota bacterium]